MTSHLKIGAQAAYFVLSRVLTYSIIGILINFITVITLWPMLMPDSDNMSYGLMQTIVSYFMPLLSWRGLLASLLFVIIFPVMYFIIGKKQGILKALHYAMNEDKLFISRYLLDKFTEYAATRKKSGKLGSDSNLRVDFLTKLENMPFIMRWTIKYFINRLGMDKLMEVLQAIEESSGDYLNQLEESSERLNRKVEFNLFAPSIQTPLYLLAVNIAVVLLVVYI